MREPEAGLSSLTRRTVRGVAWALPASLFSRAVGLVGTLVLARYLAPAEYGEVSAAAILVATAGAVTGFGVGIWLVAHREVARSDVFHASCWFLATGVAALAVVWGLREPLAAWSDAPQLGRFMPILLLGALLDRFSYVPERMLVRKLRFGWLSLARAASELAFTGVSVAAAARGAGAMAIAWGNLARSALRFAAFVPAVGWREWLEPHRLRLATLGRIIAYGLNVSLTFIAAFATTRWDNLLVSRYFGPAEMGAYNYAYNLADTPGVTVGEQMSDVVGASLPHVGQEKRAAALVRAFKMISLVMLPLAFGLGAVAPSVVRTFFDRRWAHVGTMLVFLSVLSAVKPMAYILRTYLYASERPRVVLLLEWLGLGAVIGGIAALGAGDIDWTCGWVGTAFVLRTLAVLWTIRRLDGIPVSSFLLPLAGPLAACAAMTGAIAAVRPALAGLSPGLGLLVEVALGAAVYLAGALSLFRPASREFLGLLRSALAAR